MAKTGTVRVQNLQKARKVSVKIAQKVVREILKALKLKDAEVSVIFVSAQKIRSLNIKYFGVSRSTDVIAFSQFEGERLRDSKLLGDVVVCPSVAVRQAGEYGTTPSEEAALYLVHGILHLLGYSDAEKEKRREMEKRQEKILQRLLLKVKVEGLIC